MTSEELASEKRGGYLLDIYILILSQHGVSQPCDKCRVENIATF